MRGQHTVDDAKKLIGTTIFEKLRDFWPHGYHPILNTKTYSKWHYLGWVKQRAMDDCHFISNAIQSENWASISRFAFESALDGGAKPNESWAWTLFFSEIPSWAQERLGMHFNYGVQKFSEGECEMYLRNIVIGLASDYTNVSNPFEKDLRADINILNGCCNHQPFGCPYTYHSKAQLSDSLHELYEMQMEDIYRYEYDNEEAPPFNTKELRRLYSETVINEVSYAGGVYKNKYLSPYLATARLLDINNFRGNELFFDEVEKALAKKEGYKSFFNFLIKMNNEIQNYCQYQRDEFSISSHVAWDLAWEKDIEDFRNRFAKSNCKNPLAILWTLASRNKSDACQ